MKLSKGFTLVELLVAIIILFIALGVVVGSCSGCSKIFFKKEYAGKVTKVNHFNNGQAVVTGVLGKGTGFSSAAMFSCAIEISADNEFINFSSEDRQFGTIAEGDSIRVAIFKYAPWNLDKAGTYYGGRLIKKYKIN